MRYAVLCFAGFLCISIVLGKLPNHRIISKTNKNPFQPENNDLRNKREDGEEEVNTYRHLSEDQIKKIRAVCGKTKRSSHPRGFKISNGAVAVSKQFPWVVALERVDGTQYCSGSLISHRHVVVAAHCVHEYQSMSLPCIPGELIDMNNYVISYGGVCLDEGDDCPNGRDMNQAEIESVVYLTDFHANKCVKGDDLAIIELSEDITFNSYVKPICVGDVDFKNMYEFIDAGFGRITDNEYNVALRYMRSNIEKQTDPKIITSVGVYKDELKTTASLCSGDSGGPLQARSKKDGRTYLLGAHSISSGCNGKPYHTAESTYIPYYLVVVCDVTGLCSNN